MLDELNVRALRVLQNEEGLLDYTIRPNLPKLGPKYGRDLGQVAKALSAASPAEVAVAVSAGLPVVAGAYTLQPDEVLVTANAGVPPVAAVVAAEMPLIVS